MRQRAVPMIHVPDVRETVEWYKQIGFEVVSTYGDESDGFSFAIVSFGDSQVMFNPGGRPSVQHRREVDLYVYTEDVDGLYSRFKEIVDVVEEPHDTFYGMREFILRDLNRFWITFGEESAFGKLMNAIREGDEKKVSEAVTTARPKQESLDAALAATTNPQIGQILEQAGAKRAPNLDHEKLRSYVGKYIKGNFQLTVVFENGEIGAAIGRQEPLRLMALDETTFRPIAFDNFGTITFTVEAGRTTGCTLNHGGHERTWLERAEQGDC